MAQFSDVYKLLPVLERTPEEAILERRAETSRDSPRLAEIRRDSPRFAEIRRDSPRFAEIRRDSPRLAEEVLLVRRRGAACFAVATPPPSHAVHRSPTGFRSSTAAARLPFRGRGATARRACRGSLVGTFQERSRTLLGPFP